MQAADAIALVIEGARGGVGARRDEIAVLRIEQEHQPQQDGEQALIKMLRRVAQGAIRSGSAACRPRRSSCSAPSTCSRAGWRPRPAPRGSPSAAPADAARRRCAGGTGEQQLEPAQHRPSADRRQRAERKGQPAARFAARRIDQAKSSPVIRMPMGMPASRAAGARNAGAASPPTRKGAALIRFHALRLDARQNLPAAVRVADRPIRPDSVSLSGTEEEVFRQRRAAGRAGDLRRRQPSRSVEKAQGSAGAPSSGLRRTRLPRCRLWSGSAGPGRAREHDGGDDEADGLDIAEPFVIGIVRP